MQYVSCSTNEISYQSYSLQLNDGRWIFFNIILIPKVERSLKQAITQLSEKLLAIYVYM
jgi:hypothetical protein